MATASDTHRKAQVAPAFAAPRLTDPEAAMQWHLGKLGDIQSVWADYTGKGVKVGVYDTGVEYAHGDLAANYDASLHVMVGGKVFDGDYRPTSGPHGTAVAGIIAAARNGVGTVGVAYDAGLTSVNIFDPYSGGNNEPGIYLSARGLVYEALRQADRFDVVNHSYALNSTSFGNSNWRLDPAAPANPEAEALRHVAEQGRDGLGTVSIRSAGNNGLDGQGDPVSTVRHVIAVGAYRDADGYAASYSTRGAHLLVSAPSSDELALGSTGVIATDLMGRWGFNLRLDPGGDVDYTDRFGGTSAAAPMVSGVAALMLEANEGLGWRDVKNILAASATAPIDVEAGPGGFQGAEFTRLNESRFKMVGQDAGWNGGAMHYSTDYGYGAVDARAAVRMAEVWSLFGEAKTSRNERAIASDTIDVDLVSVGTGFYDAATRHTDFASTPERATFTMGENIDLEHVDMTLIYSISFEGRGGSASFMSFSDTQLKLIAPDGTEAFVDTTLAAVGSRDPSNSFTFGFSGFRGVESAGTWAFEVLQPNGGTRTEVRTLKLDAWGAETSANDVHHYTDEFFAMAAIMGEGERRTLSDTNGGVDWVNAAAVTADVELSLLGGATTRFGGQDAFTMASGSLIENAVTGDGNDRLIGNALDNRLYGMRANDWLNGGAGNDTLFGGQGNDVFAFDTAGVSGRDKVLDWSAGDRIATSKMLRGADQNGVLTVGSSALLLLDGNVRGDTAELEGQGGATLQALGRSDGYWWYGFLTDGDESFVDGRVTELALGQTGRPAGELALAADTATTAASGVHAMQDAAFFLYNAMADTMASGVQTYA